MQKLIESGENNLHEWLVWSLFYEQDKGVKIVDSIFDLDFYKNVSYMKKADPCELSAGTGKLTPYLQKIDAITGVLAESPSDEEKLKKKLKIARIIANMTGQCKGRVSYLEKQYEMLDKIKDQKTKGAVLRMISNPYERLSFVEGVEKLIKDRNVQKINNVNYTSVYEGILENFFSLQGCLWDDETANRAVAKVNRKLDRYIREKTGITNEEYTAQKAIINALCKSFMDPTDISSEERNCFGLNSAEAEARTYAWPLLIYMDKIKWRICFPVKKEEQEKIEGAVNLATDRMIMSYMIADATVRTTPLLKENIKTGETINEGNVSLLYKTARSINYDSLFTACVLASVMELSKEKMLEDDVKRVEESKDEKSNVAVNEISRLEKENEELKALLRKTSEELDRTKEKLLNCKRDEFTIRSLKSRIDNMSSEHLEVMREKNCECREKDKEIEMLKEQLASSSETIESDAVKGTEKHIQEKPADTEKKYFFLCAHEPTAKKISATFRNSKLSTTYNVSAKNIGSFEACICIVPEIDHTSYYKVKGMCSTAGVPFIHCNTTSVETIKYLLAEHGYVA